jgi:hypothetical protein
MIRIWNYNKNRIHSYRGARYLEMYLEDQHTARKGGTASTSVIFRGEIRRAPGGVFESYEDCCECILFTTNPVVLSLIEKYDPLEEGGAEGDGVGQQKTSQPLPSFLQSGQSITSLEPSSNHLQSETSPIRTSTKPSPSPSLLLSPSPSHRGLGEPLEAQTNKASRPAGLDEFGGWDPGNLDRPTTGKRNQTKRPPLVTGSYMASSESLLAPQEAEAEADFRPFLDSSEGPTLRNPSIRTGGGGLSDEDLLSMSFDSLPSHVTQSSRNLSKTVSFRSPTKLPSSSLCADDATQFPFIRPSTALVSRQHEPIRVSAIILSILSNWGDPSRVGLSGVSALDGNFREIPLPVPSLWGGSPAAGGSAKVVTSQSQASLGNLVRGSHLSTDPSTMWALYFDPLDCGIVSLRFELASPILLRGLRIWNYNGQNEDNCAGARHIDLYLEQQKKGAVMYDGVSGAATQVASKLVLRKAPGEDDLEYAQFIHLNGRDPGLEHRTLRSQRNNSTSDLSREFEEDTLASPLTVPQALSSLSGDGSGGDQAAPAPPLSPDAAALLDTATETGTCLVNQQYETPVPSPALPCPPAPLTSLIRHRSTPAARC